MADQLISRRRFTAGLAAAGGLLVFSRNLRAAEFELRNFHNQPADSPQHKRLLEMWSAVEQETRGRVHCTVSPDNGQTPGSDPAVFKMLVDGRAGLFQFERRNHRQPGAAGERAGHSVRFPNGSAGVSRD